MRAYRGDGSGEARRVPRYVVYNTPRWARGIDGYLSGLDSSRYRSNIPSDPQEQGFGTLESQIPDKIRFKDADALIIRCKGCKAEMPFTQHVGNRHRSCTPPGPCVLGATNS